MSLTQQDFPYAHWELLNAYTGDRLRIVPERGGLITEWRSNGREILYFDQERFVQKNKSVRGGIPILFPICGSLPGECLSLEKGEFPIRQHGFARDLPWQIKPFESQDGFLLSLSDNDQSRAAYPYSFLLEIAVRLERNTLNLQVFVYNRSQDEMPFSFGLHPYFNVKNLEKIKIEGLKSSCINHFNMNNAATNYELSRIADGIDFLSGPSKVVTLVDLLTDKRLHLFHQEPMDLTVVWTDPPRNMVCLEPWTSPRNSLLTGERKLSLAPGERYKLQTKFVSD